MSLLPMWEAAPRPVSQSPPPQSQVALIKADSCASNSLTRLRSACDLTTNSCTSVASKAGLLSILYSCNDDLVIQLKIITSYFDFFEKVADVSFCENVTF